MDREKKHPIAAALAAAADVPITVFADLPEVVLSGGREIRILRHHGVRRAECRVRDCWSRGCSTSG